MTSEPDPPWPRQAVGAIGHEVVGWLRALAEILRAPRRFAAAWAAGETRPLNPLAFSLNTLAVAGPATALLLHLFGIEDDVLPLWAQLLKPLLPWIYNLVWLTPLHLALRALGGTRRLRTTIGVAFYVAGPIHLLRIFLAPLQVYQLTHPHDFRFALFSAISGLLLFVVYSIYSSAAMAGAHGLPRWRAAVAVIALFLVSATSWAFVRARTGEAGMHVIRALVT